MTSQLATMRYLVIPRVIRLAASRLGLSEAQALREFYRSRVNSLLEDEATGMWHLSAHMIAHLFLEERQTGHLTIPHEV